MKLQEDSRKWSPLFTALKWNHGNWTIRTSNGQSSTLWLLHMPNILLIFLSLLIYDLQSEDWINTYHMVRAFYKGTHATQSVKWNEMYKWKDDMKYQGYKPELISAQG